jgi:hypothetical protein
MRTYKEKEMKTARMALILGSLFLLLLSANAFAATQSGYLSGPGASYSFTVSNPGDVTFSYPKGSVDFWVTVASPNGSVSNFDLDNGEVIQLKASGMYNLTIYSKRGAGYWSAAYGGSYSPGNCNIGDTSAWGYLSGPGDTCSFTLDSYVSNLDVNFSAPGGGTSFRVEVLAKDGRTVLGDYDLNATSRIQLQGGGLFYLTVYSNRGAGNWSCAW